MSELMLLKNYNKFACVGVNELDKFKEKKAVDWLKGGKQDKFDLNNEVNIEIKLNKEYAIFNALYIILLGKDIVFITKIKKQSYSNKLKQAFKKEIEEDKIKLEDNNDNNDNNNVYNDIKIKHSDKKKPKENKEKNYLRPTTVFNNTFIKLFNLDISRGETLNGNEFNTHLELILYNLKMKNIATKNSFYYDKILFESDSNVYEDRNKYILDVKSKEIYNHPDIHKLEESIKVNQYPQIIIDYWHTLSQDDKFYLFFGYNK